MDRVPDAIFIIDCVAEKTAVAEANRVGIPVIGIADTNCNPYLLTHPIPGNDDATKAIRILTEAVAKAYEEGLKKGQVSSKNQGEEKKSEESEKSGSKTEEKAIDTEVAAAEEVVEKEALAESERVV